jgi:hypothetical protein
VIRLAVVCALASVLLLTGCGGKSSAAGGKSSSPQTIQSVVAKLGCANYQRDDTVAPGSRESGSCDLPNGDTAQLYSMPSHSAGSYLIGLAKEYGATDKNIRWYGNVLVVESSP